MKKFFLITICVLFAGATNAQTFFNGARTDYDNFFETKIGISVGMAMSGVQGTRSYFNANTLAGFSAGGTIEYPINYKLIIRGEILYSQKGFSAVTNAGNYSQRSHFVDIPLVAKLPLGALDVFAGPQFSYMVANNYDFSNNFANDRNYYKYTGSRTFMAGVVGAGYKINNKVDLNARYAIDVKGINTNGSTHLPPYRHQALQVNLGFRIN